MGISGFLGPAPANDRRFEPYWVLGCSQKCGPLLLIGHITAPNILGYENRTQYWELPSWARRGRDQLPLQPLRCGEQRGDLG